MSQGLRQSGYAPGNVAILAGNRIEFVEVLLGALYAGCVPVLLDPKWKTNVLTEAFEKCGPRILFAESLSGLSLKENETPTVRLGFSESGPAASYAAWLSSFEKSEGSISFNEKLFIGYTSGTTGSPKAYSRTHQSWIRSFEASAEAFRLSEREHVCAPGPFIHSLTLFALMHALYNGSTFHMLERFDAAKLLDLCTDFPGMALHVVPAMIDALTTFVLDTQRHAPIGALISSGSSWSERSKQRCRELFPAAELYEYYGSSEASYISYRDARKPDRSGALGRPFKGVDLSIRDEYSREVLPGQIGQLYVRSDMVFTGYEPSEENPNVFSQEGWLRTGDEVFGDAENGLYLAGRSGDLIKSGGLKVFPEEVEAVLQRIPEIEQAVVFGESDERWGEQVAAAVRWRSAQHRLTLDEIRLLCSEHLENYKIPKRLIDTDHFPYTNSGKIARRQLRKQAEGGSG